MSKISSDHLGRAAYVCVRQSTMAQVQYNHESQRRQYGLSERARLLGWQDVTVVDDDLGRSGSGVARPGFDRLLTAVGRGEVGAVFAIEASRLARNGRDWHTLLDLPFVSVPSKPSWKRPHGANYSALSQLVMCWIWTIVW